MDETNPAIARQKRNIYQNQWRRQNRHRRAPVDRNSFLKRRYGITTDDFETLLTQQNAVCAICHKPPNSKGHRATTRLHVDHNHKTGQIRGLLCHRCNIALGGFGDDALRLRAAIQYLEGRDGCA